VTRFSIETIAQHRVAVAADLEIKGEADQRRAIDACQQQ
jgi:hypothetical protein